MKNNKIKYALLYFIAAIPIILTILLYNKLPDQIPMHWDIQGQVNRYGNKTESFITACIPLLIVILMQGVPLIDPKKRNYEKFIGSYYNFQLMFAIIMGALHLLTLSTAMGYEFVKVDSGVKLLIAILFTIIGNMMPKFKHNYFIGIKTPWTLASEEVWFATHRMGGKLWFYGGLAMIVLSFISGPVSGGIYFSVILGTSLIMFIYSYLVFRKLQNSVK